MPYLDNYEYLKNQADSGDCAAQIELGRAYEFGNTPNGVNYDMCFKYYMISALGDVLTAMRCVGFAIRHYLL